MVLHKHDGVQETRTWRNMLVERDIDLPRNAEGPPRGYPGFLGRLSGHLPAYGEKILGAKVIQLAHTIA